MSAVNLFNAGTAAGIQALVNALTAVLPTSVPSSTGSGTDTFSGFDFLDSPGFRIVLEVSSDGQSVTLRSVSGDQGQNNAYGPTDGTPVQPGGTVQHYLRVPPITIPASLIT